MSRIFISYRREDSAGEAGRIYDCLERKFGREAIFKDVDAIAFGDNFRDRIHEAVAQCEILLTIIGPRWLQVQDTAGRRRLDNPADWVRLEIETALQRDVRVIPVLLDGVGMPAMQDLPEPLQPLCYRHAARVRHDPDFRTDIKRVIEVVAQHLQKTPQREVKQSAEQLFDSARAKVNSGDKQGALADCDKAIQINPNYADAYKRRSAIKFALGDKQGALADCDKAIQINPDYADAYYNRGVVKSDLGDKQGALVDYNKAIQIDPDHAVAYINRGNAKDDLGDKQGAITDYDKAIQIKPDYANVYNNRGFSKSALGDKQGAIADYQKAMHLAKQQGNTATYDLAKSNLEEIS